MPRIDLKVPFHEKEEVKKLGAKWDADNKVWFVPDGIDSNLFIRWIPNKTHEKINAESTLFKKWTDEECIDVWNKFRAKHSSTELMYVLYGGLLTGDLKLEGGIHSLRQYKRPPPTPIIFDFSEAEAEEQNIIYTQEIPSEIIKEIASHYVFDEAGQELCDSGYYSERQVKYLTSYFQITAKD